MFRIVNLEIHRLLVWCVYQLQSGFKLYRLTTDNVGLRVLHTNVLDKIDRYRREDSEMFCMILVRC